jgi:asparagine synthase (glutamine-hydrolysing)
MLNKPVTIYSEDEALVLLQNALLNSVALRIPREVPFACLLSGGVDSSLVAAMVCEHEKIDTFCLGYEGYEKYDERAFAQRVASHIGSRHHEVILSKEDFFQTVDEVINGLDEPIADPAMIPLYFLMRQLKKEGFKVVLTGDGSDELFMGYRTYKELYALESLKSFEFKGWMQRYLKSNFSMHKEWEWYKRVFESTLLFRSTAELFTDLQQNRLLRMNVKDNHSTQALQEYVAMFEKSQRTSPIDWYSFLDIKITLGDLFLRKLDRMSMAHGIEARSPFLDKEVVAVAFSSDPKIRMGKTSKSLVKKVAQTYLPKEIVHRKKKGFNYPYIEWLYGSDELKVIDRVQEKMGLFHEEVLKEYLKKGEQGVLKQHIFAIYLLCKWIEKHILD